MSARNARLQALQHALSQRILILDGGMGTMIQSYKLEESDYRGERFADWPSDVKGNNDLLLLSRPDVIQAIEKAYLDAGADILETNTFNATRVSQADYGMEELVYELNVEGARLAREVADAKTAETPDRPRFVAGVLGPTSRTCSISPDVNNPGYRNVTFDLLVENYTEATRGLIEGGADLILDMVGGSYIPKNIKALAPDGRLVMIAFLEGPEKLRIELLDDEIDAIRDLSTEQDFGALLDRQQIRTELAVEVGKARAAFEDQVDVVVGELASQARRTTTLQAEFNSSVSDRKSVV